MQSNTNNTPSASTKNQPKVSASSATASTAATVVTSSPKRDIKEQYEKEPNCSLINGRVNYII